MVGYSISDYIRALSYKNVQNKANIKALSSAYGMKIN